MPEMARMTRLACVLIVVLATFFVIEASRAGEVLRLKQGDVAAKAGDPRWLQEPVDAAGKGRPRYFVVQFQDKIRQEDHLNLSSLGARILRYVPEDALLIEATAKEARTIAKSSPGIRVVVPYQSRWKLAPEIPAPSVFTAERELDLLIRLFPEIKTGEVHEKIRSVKGLKTKHADGRSLVASVAMHALEALSRIEGIEWIQPAPQVESFYLASEIVGEPVRMKGDYSDLNGFESGTRVMGFASAWGRGFLGEGQVVATADTGLDRGDESSLHGDFEKRAAGGFAFGVVSKSWEDPMGHGTHVAGSLLGDGRQSAGLLSGGAPRARLLVESLWSPLLENLTVPPKLRDLFDKAYGKGARIHSNSWGAPKSFGAYDGMAQQVDEYVFAHPDFLVLFAAGNGGEDQDHDGRIDAQTVSSPGTAKNALTVGASENLVLHGGIQKKLGELRDGAAKWGREPLASDQLSNDPTGLAMFSARGPTADGRIKPEVVAPGTNILSTRSRHPDAQTLWGEYNADYVWSGGTSMATPLVAGAAAVVREYLIKAKKLEAPSAAAVKGVLMHTAYDLFPGQFGAIGRERGQEILASRPNPDEGYGRVDLERATALERALVVDEKAGLGQGESHSYPIHVNRDGRLSITLVYTDAPAAASSARALVNDLDLALIDHRGEEIVVLSDRVNNHEIIERSVATGDYELRVRSFNVPQGLNGKQPYALIVSIREKK